MGTCALYFGGNVKLGEVGAVRSNEIKVVNAAIELTPP